MASTLEQLRNYSIIVADSGDFEAVKKYQPKESTTNPSLLLQAAQQDRYKGIIDSVLKKCKDEYTGGDLTQQTVDELYVTFASELLQIVPGRVSVEVNITFRFNVFDARIYLHF